MNKQELQAKAQQLRIDTIMLLDHAGSGHVGGPLGMADMFTAVYYDFANISSGNFKSEDRDIILLSNGHICPIWYATLIDKGIIPETEKDGLRKLGRLLEGHPKTNIPGVENSSGPLGHGLSQAIGQAIGYKMDGKNNRVICFTSDGEHQEGQTWEAIMSAPKWGLDNLISIMDLNGIQIEGTTDEIMPMGSLEDKYRQFGWSVITIDGHDFDQIQSALSWADEQKGPVAILAETISGKGAKYMEGNPDYHDWSPSKHNVEELLKELSS